MSEKSQVAKVLVPVPDLTGKTEPQGLDLSESQQKAVEEVLAHFDKPDYRLPVKGELDGTLSEEEKFWLVSVSRLHRRFALRLMNALWYPR